MAEVNFGLLNTQLPGQIANIAGNAAQEGRANAMQMIQLQHGLAQNRLADLTYGEQMRQIEEQKQIRNALAGVDINTPQGQIDAIRKATQISPKMGFDLQKNFSEAEKRRVEMAKLKAETDKIEFEKGLKNKQEFFQTLRQASTNPTDEAVQMAFSRAVSLGVPMQEAAQDQARILAMSPDQRAQTLAAYGAAAADMMKRVEPKIERFQTPGGGVDFMNMNPNRADFGQRPTGVTQMAPKMTPYETEQTNQGKQRIGLERERVGLEGRRVTVLEAAEKRDKDPEFQQRLAAAKATGQAVAKNVVEAQQALPRVLEQAEIAIQNIDAMVGGIEVDKNGKEVKGKPHPGFQDVVGATWKPGLRFVPGTDAADFMRRFDQVTGESFLQAYETLRGAQAITDIEGAKATAAKQRLSIAQSEKEFDTAARESRAIILKGFDRAKKMAAGKVGKTYSDLTDEELKRRLGM